MSYFVIKGSEDGTKIFECKNIEGLTACIKDCGIKIFRSTLGTSYQDKDTNYWNNKEALIIKGEVITPKPKKVVEEWEF